MILGISGHQKLVDKSAWFWVEKSMYQIMKDLIQPLIGVTSLAIGADQLFAENVLKLGGKLHVVIPFSSYRQIFKIATDIERYDQLFNQANKVEILKQKGSHEECYLAAGKRVVELSDCLFAVWDGQKAKGLGGTGDVVEYALKENKKIVQFNPVTREVLER